VTCPKCSGTSVPGALPRSEHLRIGIFAPWVFMVLAGLNFLKFINWASAVLFALVPTMFAVAWLQLKLPLTPATASQIENSRSHNKLAYYAAIALSALAWYF
jgi:hypothetical protein